jgi:hypothetical protein
MESQNEGDNVSPAPEFFLVVICVNPALASRHQGQSGTAGPGLVWHCQALLKWQQASAMWDQIN